MKQEFLNFFKLQAHSHSNTITKKNHHREFFQIADFLTFRSAGTLNWHRRSFTLTLGAWGMKDLICHTYIDCGQLQLPDSIGPSQPYIEILGCFEYLSKFLYVSATFAQLGLASMANERETRKADHFHIPL